MHHLSPEQLQQLKQQLLQQQASLSKQLEQNDHFNLQEPIRETLELSAYDNHPADLGTEMFERAKDLALNEHAERQIEQVDQALSNMDNHSYGICKICDQPIPYERMEAIPYTQYCVEHSRDQFVSYNRPIEESVLVPPFGRTSLDELDTTQFDGEDAWQSVAMMGTSNSPAYAEDNHVDDYGEMYIEAEEPVGFVEPIESFLATDLYGRQAMVVRNPEYRQYLQANEGEALLEATDME